VVEGEVITAVAETIWVPVPAFPAPAGIRDPVVTAMETAMEIAAGTVAETAAETAVAAAAAIAEVAETDYPGGDARSLIS